jgi:ABC-type multidrug transport system permease subunit
MKLISVINKSIKEQLRHFGILVLTISMAPFFVFVYYLIIETSKPHYDLLILNNDQGAVYQEKLINYGKNLTEAIENFDLSTVNIPFRVKITDNRTNAIAKLKNKKTDALIIIPGNFSRRIQGVYTGSVSESIELEFIGDLTNLNYMITALWVNEIVNDYIYKTTKKVKPLEITETSLGISGNINDFDICIPGILILSIIMLMFSATIAIVTEVENKTIIRLKLSGISTLEFLTGISVVQIGVGIISVFFTLVTAILLGFEYAGSLWLLFFISVLTCISIIAFSLIVAAITKTVNEVLVVGNFPLFLFMFFTGAAFPLKGKALFVIAGYPVSIQGFMSPTHSIRALSKVLIMGMGLPDIIPEIIAVLLLTIVYFIIGVFAFRTRHMK